MDAREYGRYLSRGGRKIKVEKAEDRFTATVSVPGAATDLAMDEAVEEIETLTDSVVQVKVKGAPDRETAERRDTAMERLRSQPGMVIHHEYRRAGGPEERYQITDEIIVQFDTSVGSERVAAILESTGVVIKKSYPHLGNSFLIKVIDSAGENPLKVANRLEEQDEVVYAEPVVINRFVNNDFPSDTLFPAQWHLYSKEMGEPDIARDADANVAEAWQITKGTREVVIAVLDDGFELTHPDFLGPGKIVHPTDFRGDDTSPLPGPTDYHGTSCAGVATAEENGEGCVGVAPGCALMPVRFPLNAPDPWLIEIFSFVSQRAHIAACSWGTPPGDYPLNSAVYETLAQLVQDGGADGRGLVIVFAAGNYDAPVNEEIDYALRWLDQDLLGHWRLFETTGRIVNGFAAHPDTVTVTASTSLNRKSLYSNWGREVSVAAPSDNFDPTTHNRLLGRAITTTDNEEFGEDFTPGKRYTNSFGGTSSAAPVVAGVAALMKSANPALTAAEIKQILEQTADQITDEAADPLYGHQKGVYEDEFCEWFGYGKVNAQGAVRRALQYQPEKQRVEIEQSLDLPIPDYPGPPVITTTTIVQAGVISDIAVEVDITHPWCGDLVVSLLAPSGATVQLHDRNGFRKNNLNATYTDENTPALAMLLGAQAHGEWQLQVADRARQDSGVLKKWGLDLTLVPALSSVEPVPASSAVDDLSRIRGIGSSFSQRLTESGVTTFRALARLHEEEIKAIIQPRPFQRPDYASWRKQAREMHGSGKS